MSVLPAPALAPARRDALHAWVADVRAHLLLAHWRIDIPDEWPPEGDEVIAGINPCDGRYVATIRFGPSFWNRSPDEQRATLVHELLHLHHVRLTDVIRLGDWREQIGQAVYDGVYSSVKREAEYMVDALTSIVAEHAPMPPEWPDA